MIALVECGIDAPPSTLQQEHQPRTRPKEHQTCKGARSSIVLYMHDASESSLKLRPWLQVTNDLKSINLSIHNAECHKALKHQSSNTYRSVHVLKPTV